MNKATCDLCPRYCKLAPQQIGFCGSRMNVDGKINSLSYGKITSIALDPIEKKPLSYYKPGTRILSVGSFGCNMACAFCQNYEIARAKYDTYNLSYLSPEDLVNVAVKEKIRGNIGLAFTYNEPLIIFEYLLDSALLAKEAGLDMVLVTNGQINDKYLDQLLPYINAWNIDLKVFSKEKYRALGGDFQTTLNTIEKASKNSHVEVTTLVVPGISDDLEAFEKEVEFLASISKDIPLHLTRYFPRYKYHEEATQLDLLYRMEDLASKKLNRVILGNI